MVPFVAAIVMMIFVSGFVFFYHPRTKKGWCIKEEWNHFNRTLSSMKSSDWQKWGQSEQMKTFVFGLGINNRQVKKWRGTLKKICKR